MADVGTLKARAFFHGGRLIDVSCHRAIHYQIRRVRGARGEGDVRSAFEKAHRVQLLTAEYVPIISALIVYLELRRSTGDKDDRDHAWWVKAAMILATAGRFVFARRAQDFSVDAHGYNMMGKAGDGVVSAWGFRGAMMTYVGLAGLCVGAVTR